MTKISSQIPATSSRLVRFLAELGVADAAPSHRHFTERLGQLFDLPDSIAIARVHSASPAAILKSPELSAAEITAKFLRARAAIISNTLRGFAPGAGPMRLRFPAVTADMTPEQTMTPEPYLAFYAAQQRDIDFRVRNLHAATRDAVADFSPGLAQLVALDTALGGPLSAHHRRFYSAVCGLLQKRIDQLLEEYRQSVSDNQHKERLWAGTEAQLRAEMQELLLAEIETRLLPALGLIEALDEHEDE